MKNKLQKVIKRQDQPEQVNKPARITNDNLAEHREEVIGRARRFIYPLQHSKHSLVKISVGILVAALVLFTAYCVIALYRLKSSSEFLYQVTNVVPFPVARIGSDFVAYENYLFEINRYKHYYQNQQNVDFNSENGKRQLEDFKRIQANEIEQETLARKAANVHAMAAIDAYCKKEKEIEDAKRAKLDAQLAAQKIQHAKEREEQRIELEKVDAELAAKDVAFKQRMAVLRAQLP